MDHGRTLRVGVTGHRHLAAPDDVAAEVDRVLDRVEHGNQSGGHQSGGHQNGGVSLVVVSSLAEGADRLVADRVLARPGSALHAVLPLEPDDYATDFTDAASRQAFQRLLDAAAEVTLSPRQESREAAYEAAGRAVLEECDVLLALWDGQPPRGRGGTAQLVAEARAAGRPVEVIHVERAADAPVP